MIARLGNALHWAFSGVAVLLLLCAVMTIWGNPDPTGSILFVFMFLGVPALLAWLVGRGCHYVLGGDASALWERALIARARRSPGFRKVCISIVLLAVVSVALSILDAKDREARREQQYEQQRQAEERQAAEQRQAAERQAAERQQRMAEASRQEAARAAAERTAAIAAERERKAAALRATTINAAALTINTSVKIHPWGAYLSGTIVNNSNQTLRAVEFEVTWKDCLQPQCRITLQQNVKFNVNIPPSQQRDFRNQLLVSSSSSEDREYKDLPKYSSWSLVTASACPWDDHGNRSKLNCP